MQNNFKYLDDLSHSGVKGIVLDSDIVLSDGEESEYKKGIKLDVDDLAIDGNGHAIDAQGKTRIFFCSGKNISIKNIILKKGCSESGGAIDNRGELTIMKSSFTGNTAKEEGAISLKRQKNLNLKTALSKTMNLIMISSGFELMRC